MHLPPSQGFDSQTLVEACEVKTNCYKVALLKAVLSHVGSTEGGKDFISDADLVDGMLESVWYPAARYRLSLGHSDLLGGCFSGVPEEIKDGEGYRAARVYVDFGPKNPREGILRYPLSTILTHWLKKAGYAAPPAGQTVGKGFMRLVAENAEAVNLPYVIEEKGMRLRRPFIEYVLANHSLLEGWLDYQMIGFLQSRNPNVPGIPLKLRPEERPGLDPQKRIWTAMMRERGGFDCIYGCGPVNPSGYHLDHFIPWAFVAHHRIWNLVPTVGRANLSKGASLPEPGLVAGMAAAQFGVIGYLKGSPSKASDVFLGEYWEDLGIEPAAATDYDGFRDRYSEKMMAIHSLASQRFRIWDHAAFKDVLEGGNACVTITSKLSGESEADLKSDCGAGCHL